MPLGCEAPAPVVVVGRVGPRFQFAQRVAELARASFVDSVGDAVFDSSVHGPPRSLEFEGGRCACGKLSLLLSRCARCAREEQAALTAEEEGMSLHRRLVACRPVAPRLAQSGCPAPRDSFHRSTFSPCPLPAE